MKSYMKKGIYKNLNLEERIRIIEEQNEEIKKLKGENKIVIAKSKNFEKRIIKALKELQEQQYSSIVNLKNRLITILEFPEIIEKESKEN